MRARARALPSRPLLTVCVRLCSQREGDESPSKMDPAWGYTGHPYAHRYDAGEEDLSMASRISRRRAQNILSFPTPNVGNTLFDSSVCSPS